MPKEIDDVRGLSHCVCFIIGKDFFLSDVVMYCESELFELPVHSHILVFVEVRDSVMC